MVFLVKRYVNNFRLKGGQRGKNKKERR